MSSKIQIYIISFFFIIIGISLMTYKVQKLDFPLFSNEKRTSWSIEAKVTFEATDKAAFISLALPQPQKGMSIYNKDSASPNFGYTETKAEGNIRGEWAKRKIEGKQTLYYKIDLFKDSKENPKEIKQSYQSDYKPEVDEVTLQAVNAILKEAYSNSANDISLASQIISDFNKKDNSQAIKMIKNKYIKSSKNLRDVIVILLQKKDVKVRRVGALKLADKQNNIKLKPMFEVFNNKEWVLFDIHSGQVNKTENLFIWRRGNISLIDTEGVKKSKVRFTISKKIMPAKTAALLKNNKKEKSFMNFSLFVLPNESQNTFKHLLLVPIGAFLVVFLRIFVGLKTSGTFMPVLLAMAFVQTDLIPGLIMFISVVGLGLIIRSYLSALNLLLVARISAVLIIVVGIMAMISVFAYKLGFNDAIRITFFPMIILAWTIERMSITWEEDGAKEVFKQGGGSLFVATLAFFAMTNSVMEYWTFNFPEFLLIILGLIILLGRYSGYRLSELYRFASLAERIEE